MPVNKGKSFLLQRDSDGLGTFVTVGGLRATSMTINNEQIDVTSKDGTYWRQMIAGGVRSMSISGGGVMDNSTHVKALRLAAMANTFNDYRIINEDGDYFEGEFQLTSWGESGEYNGATEYTLSLESSGDIAFTDV